MKTPYSAESAVAINAVRCATRICMEIQHKIGVNDSLMKADQTPVTVADLVVQAVVGAHLEDAFPEDLVVGEEESADLRGDDREIFRHGVLKFVGDGLRRQVSEDEVIRWIDRCGHTAKSGRYWTLDPIDGTKGFLRGDQYAIALALIEDGHVVLGLLACPNLMQGGTGEVLFVAEGGKGSWAVPLEENEGGVPIRVSEIQDPRLARYVESVESAHSDQGIAADIAEQLGVTAEPLRLDSQAKYAVVARGNAQIYLRPPPKPNHKEKIWDHAAGMLLVEEAGGRVTDLDGKRLDFIHGRFLEGNRGVVATNRHFHDAVLNAIRAVEGKS